MEHVLSGLIKHRAELAGKIEAAEIALNAMIDDLRDVDRVIRQFDPGMDCGAIPVKRVRLASGKTARAILDVLRDGKATCRDIAMRIKPEADKAFIERVRAALHYQCRKGTVEAEAGADGVVRWGIV